MSFIVDDYPVAAGQELPIHAEGKYFAILDSDYPVTVKFKQNNSVFGYANGVTFGFSAPFEKGFSSVSIKTDDVSKAQTVKLAFTDDPVLYQKLVGNVTVTNAPDITSLINPLTPPTLDTHFTYIGVSTALQTIVAPAANTGGVIIYGMSMRSNLAISRIMGKTSAPASPSDITAITLMVNLSNDSAGMDEGDQDIVLPFILPAGMGLYAQKNGTNVNDYMSVNYKVL